MTPIIELENLGIKFGSRQILDQLNVKLTGRAIGLLGPNGAGKTTLIHTLLGCHPPTSGSAKIFGRDISSEAKEIRGMIGFMPERDSFIANMTCVHFVRLMAELSGLPSDAALERAHEALFYVGLGEARYRELGSYSLGMKQLAKLAQAIVHGPKLIILDEPTNGLDPPARQRMIELIREIRDSRQAQVLLSSHLLHDVEECCEEILIMKNGRIAAHHNLEAERKASKLGFGELMIAHLLATATGKTYDQILNEFKSGTGWGKIAKENNVKLGGLVSKAHESAQGAEHGKEHDKDHGPGAHGKPGGNGGNGNGGGNGGGGHGKGR